MENFPINMTMSGLSGDGCDVAANVMIDGSVSPSTSSGVSSLASSYVVPGSNGYVTTRVNLHKLAVSILLVSRIIFVTLIWMENVAPHFNLNSVTAAVAPPPPTPSSRLTEAEALLALSNQSETDADEGIVSDQSSSASSTASSSDLTLQRDSSNTIKVRQEGSQEARLQRAISQRGFTSLQPPPY